MSSHTVEIKSQDALRHQVLINGVDVSKQAKALTLIMRASSPPELALGLNIPEGVAVELAGSEVTLAPETARLLVSLGWAPPPVGGPHRLIKHQDRHPE